MSKKSVKSNFLYNMIYQILLMILPLITSPYLSRVIGAEGVGAYSYTYSVANYFVMFAMLGILNYGNRKIAAISNKQDCINSTFSRIFVIQCITSVFSIFLYLIYLFFFVDKNYTLLSLYQLPYVVSAFFDINWLFFGLEEFKITVTRKVGVKILSVLGIFLLVHNKDDLLVYTAIMSISVLLGQVYMWLNLRKYVSFVPIELSDLLLDIKPIIILFVPIIATSVYRIMDKIMIGQLSDMSGVGQYENAEKIIMVCLGVISAMGTVMLPKMSNLYANGKISEANKYLEESMEICMFMSCAIAFGVASIAKDFAPLFFGKEFVLCGDILFALTPTVIFIGWANVIRNQYLIPREKDFVYLVSVSAGAILNFALNLFCIPKFGTIGAVIGTFIAEFSVAFLQTFLIRKDLNIHMMMKKTIIFISFGLLMHAFCCLFDKIFVSALIRLFTKIFLGAILYLILSMTYFIKTKNRIIMNIFKKFAKKI